MLSVNYFFIPFFVFGRIYCCDIWSIVCRLWIISCVSYFSVVLPSICITPLQIISQLLYISLPFSSREEGKSGDLMNNTKKITNTGQFYEMIGILFYFSFSSTFFTALLCHFVGFVSLPYVNAKTGTFRPQKLRGFNNVFIRISGFVNFNLLILLTCSFSCPPSAH
jgi:magnesium-transporting ATPase (P-type)